MDLARLLRWQGPVADSCEAEALRRSVMAAAAPLRLAGSLRFPGGEPDPSQVRNTAAAAFVLKWPSSTKPTILPRRPRPLVESDVPLWASLYLLAIAALAAWAVIDDVRQGNSRLRVAADIAAIVVLCYLFAGHFLTGLAEPLGRSAAPLFIVAFLWTGIAAQREIVQDNDDPELSARANFIAAHLGIALGVVVFSPLLAFAAVTAFQLW
jgi:hypothetical protein